MNNGYRAILRATLRHRWVIGVIFIVVLGSMVFLFKQLKSELSPVEDRGLFMAFVIAPEGSTMSYTDGYMHVIEGITSKIPEITTMYSVGAPELDRPNPVNICVAISLLKPWRESKRSQL